MLKDVKVTHCVIGHSERRMMFADTDETVNKKQKLIENGIVPIVCIGESEAQYDNGETESVIRSQLNGSLAGLDPKAVEDIVVAMNQFGLLVQENQQQKKLLKTAVLLYVMKLNMFGEDAANKVRIQYGGLKPIILLNTWLEDIDGA